MKYEYVISGLGWGKFVHFDKKSDVEREAAHYINHCIEKLQGRNSHSIALLFNAYTEVEIGSKINEFFYSCSNVYGDSGGLQVVSRGFKITPDLKDKIYETQAKHATIGMIFDEIPVRTDGSSLGNQFFIGNRVFLPDEVEKFARETARNIKRQIDTFTKLGSDCKPCAILQGNDQSTFQRWAEALYAEMGDDYSRKCCGIALADTAHGTGLLDDIDRLFTATQLQIPTYLSKQIHLLGVGRIRRLLPLAIFAENGLLPQTEVISYDSTTHTRAITIGYHMMNDVMFNFAKDPTAWKLVEEDICSKTLDLFDYEINRDLLKYHLVNGPRTTSRETGERYSSAEIRDIIKCLVSTILVSIDNFCETVYNCTHDDNVLFKAVLDSKSEFYALKQVKSADDFKYWMNTCSRRLRSSKVQVKQDSLEDDLF